MPGQLFFEQRMADKIIEVSTEAKRMNINAKKPQRKNFRWETDFDADKPAQHKHLREAMANIYEDVSLFGPLAVTPLPDDFEQLSKEDKAKTKLLQTKSKSKELIEKGK